MPYQTLFEPVVKPRENVRLIPLNKFYKVLYLEPVWNLMINLGTVSSDTEQATLTEVKEIDLNDGWLGQWRICLLDDFDLVVRQRRANERGATKDKVTRISPYIMALDPELRSTEFYTFGDDYRIYVKASNKGRKYDVVARILFYGWKYKLQGIQEPAKYTDIILEVVT